MASRNEMTTATTSTRKNVVRDPPARRKGRAAADGSPPDASARGAGFVGRFCCVIRASRSDPTRAAPYAATPQPMCHARLAARAVLIRCLNLEVSFSEPKLLLRFRD